LDAVDRFADQIALSKTVIRRRIAQRETLSLAQRFQAGMLPPLPDQDLLTVRTLYRPGHQQMLLGGDFLDVLSAEGSSLSFVLGDVAGHGPEQAALGATLRGAWLSVASDPVLGPREWAQALNRVVHARAPHEGLFVTALMGRLNPALRTLDYVSAGHPPPIMLRPTVEGAPHGDTVLGVDPHLEFTVHNVDLPERWALLVVTDGLFEGRLPSHETPHGDYHDFVAYLQETHQGDIHDPSWLNDLADTLETANGGPLSDDAAALLLAPRT
jgi:serine phosphatase RsbU (regulator of sigma subunit)